MGYVKVNFMVNVKFMLIDLVKVKVKGKAKARDKAKAQD